MITTEGKAHIKRFLSGYSPQMVQAIAFGIGATAENLADTSLAFEAGRTAVDFPTYDNVLDNIVYKVEIPEEVVGKIYEVGLYSQFDNSSAGTYSSNLVTSFDSETETWLTGGGAPVYTTANTRIGIDSLNHTPALSATATSTLSNVLLDYSGYAASDTFLLAVNVGNANTASLNLRFRTSSGNHFTATWSNPSTGYLILSATKGSFTATGSPTWSNITEVEVSTVSKASGASAVDYDGVRIEDRDTVSTDYVLVARKVLVSPITKVEGQPQDIEYALHVTL